MKLMKKTSLMVSMMLLASIFVGFGFLPSVGATTTYLSSGDSIQNIINASAAGDLIILHDGWYVPAGGVLHVNESVTLRSANGSSNVQINGTLNITVDDVMIGGSSTTGITIYQQTLTAGTNAVEIGMNGTRDNISIYFCQIIGGCYGVLFGFPGGTADNYTNMTLYSNMIYGQGGAGIRSAFGWLKYSYIYGNQIFNTSNVKTNAAILLDGAKSTDISSNIIYDTITYGGEGINFTGLFHPTDDMILQWNNIYRTNGYSSIVIRSLADTEYVQDMRIIGNDLGNNSYIMSEAGLRFDNVSGLIVATNISVFFNKFNTSSRDIEERFELTAVYDNWTGVMPAYFNWYGHTQAGTAGTFRDSTHLIATPYLLSSNAFSDIRSYGTIELTGAASGYVNNTAYADANVSGTSTDDLIVVIYSYPMSLLATYPARSMHKYIEVGTSNASRIDYPANITFYYTEADLETRGWAERHLKGLVFYNFTSGEWEEFNNTGVDTTDVMGYEGFAWANVYDSLDGTIVAIVYKTITDDDDDDGGTDGTDSDVDTDGDGLPDWLEDDLGTDSDNVDTDGDGYSDYEEYIAGSDPLDANSIPSVLPVIFGLSLVYWIVIIVIIVILVLLIAIMMNKEAKKKWRRFWR